MSAEPNRSIDEQLQAFARQRLSGLEGSRSLPPAIRASIRAEAARQRTARQEEPAPVDRPLAHFWQALWPRLAIAAALTVFLTIAATSWFPKPYDHPITFSSTLSDSRAPETMNRTEPQVAVAPVESPRPPALPVAPDLPPPNLADTPAAPAIARETALATPADPPQVPRAKMLAVANEPAAAPSAAPSALETAALAIAPDPSPDLNRRASPPEAAAPTPMLAIETAVPASEASRQLALAHPAAAPAPGNAVESTAGLDAGTRWLFTRTNPPQRLRRNMNSPPTPNLLTRFELHRAGERIWIVDADGSTYEGGLQYGNASVKTVDAAIAFQAVGTNRTSKSRVVVTGRVIPSTPLAPTLLQAKAVLNGGVEIPVDARAESP